MQKDQLEIRQHRRHLLFGILYILIAWFFITSVATLSRFATQKTSLSMVLFFQNFISWLTVLPWIIKHGISSLKTEKLGLILVRSIGGLLSFAFLFLAVDHTSLVDSLLLNNAAPLLVPFVVWGWLRIPINHKLWPGIGLGFVGILFVLKPGKEIINLGAIYGLLAAVLLSIVMVSLRLLSYSVRNHVVLFYYFLIGSLISLPFMLHSPTWPDLTTWCQLIGIGLLSALGQWAFMRAFHYAKPSQLGPFCYSAVIYSGLFEWFLYGKVPDLISFIGIGLVCLGGVWTICFSHPPANSFKQPPPTIR